MDPYTTPKSRQSSNKKPLNSELREIVIGWERMRILYNIILFIVGIIAILALTRSPHFELSEAILPAISLRHFILIDSSLLIRTSFRNDSKYKPWLLNQFPRIL